MNIQIAIDDGFVPFPEHEEVAITEFIAPPADTPDYLRGVWWSFLCDAVSDANVRNKFRADTRSRWGQGATPIPYRLEKCAGADRAELEAFAAWFNKNIWQAGFPT